MAKTMKFADLEIPVPGFGAMGMSYSYGSFDEEQNMQTLKHAVEIGCTWWDTAGLYGAGLNEELLGRFIKANNCRDKVFVASKFGGRQFDPVTRQKTGFARGDRQYVKDMLRDSTERLGFAPDLWYQHRCADVLSFIKCGLSPSSVDPNTPIEETVQSMEEERLAGRCKYLGLSECSAETLRRACKVAQIHAYQVEFSPWFTDIEKNGVAEACRELGVAIIAYSPLGRGFLTGRYQSNDDFEEGDFRKDNDRFTGDNFQKNMKLVEELGRIADKKGCTKAQLCLAWIMARGYIPIPGTRSIKYLDENFASRDNNLSKDEMAEMQRVVDSVEVVGQRYNDRMLAATFL